MPQPCCPSRLSAAPSPNDQPAAPFQARSCRPSPPPSPPAQTGASSGPCLRAGGPARSSGHALRQGEQTLRRRRRRRRCPWLPAGGRRPPGGRGGRRTRPGGSSAGRGRRGSGGGRAVRQSRLLGCAGLPPGVTQSKGYADREAGSRITASTVEPATSLPAHPPAQTPPPWVPPQRATGRRRSAGCGRDGTRPAPGGGGPGAPVGHLIDAAALYA